MPPEHERHAGTGLGLPLVSSLLMSSACLPSVSSVVTVTLTSTPMKIGLPTIVPPLRLA